MLKYTLFGTILIGLIFAGCSNGSSTTAPDLSIKPDQGSQSPSEITKQIPSDISK